jgi:Fe-Mn family superoxide dismutase
MNLRETMHRVEQIGVCKWRDREHVLQLVSLIPGLEMPFVRLLHEWSLHLSAAEAEAREWFGALQTRDVYDAGDWEEYRDFERRMLQQSREFIRQLSLMREHSPTLRHSRACRSFIAHIVQDAQLITVLLERDMAGPADNDSADAGIAGVESIPAAANRREGHPIGVLPVMRFILKRKPGGGWSLVR